MTPEEGSLTSKSHMNTHMNTNVFIYEHESELQEKAVFGKGRSPVPSDRSSYNKLRNDRMWLLNR